MIKSMTGFANGTISLLGESYSVVIKSVNSKYLDMSIKIPYKYSGFERDLRTTIGKHINRGKISFQMKLISSKEQSIQDKLNNDVVEQYLNFCQEYGKKYSQAIFSISEILQLQGVLEDQENKVCNHSEYLKFESQVLKILHSFDNDRNHEGENLKFFLSNSINQVEEIFQTIDQNKEVIQQEYFEKIKERIIQVEQVKTIDEQRLWTEIALLLEKSDITEELVRLKKHIELFKVELESAGSLGKKLDFIIQEMFREINTSLAKITRFNDKKGLLKIKLLVEQIREQVQNIE